MILLHRPPTPPAVLAREGAVRRAEHERDHDADSAAFRRGARQFDFSRDIYAHKDVKDALVGMQHEKCAFCEAKPLPVSDGDIEHFRPKGAVRAKKGGRRVQPGYYWLAYEWENLLLACGRCNRRHKRDEFPLAVPAHRAADHRADVTLESPMLVDPSREDPTLVIGFRDHVPHAVGGDARGETTIEVLGLRRPELNRDREEHLERLYQVFLVATLPAVPRKLRDEATALLDRATAAPAEYSAMSSTAVAGWRASARRRR